MVALRPSRIFSTIKYLRIPARAGLAYFGFWLRIISTSIWEFMMFLQLSLVEIVSVDDERLTYYVHRWLLQLTSALTSNWCLSITNGWFFPAISQPKVFFSCRIFRYKSRRFCSMQWNSDGPGIPGSVMNFDISRCSNLYFLNFTFLFSGKVLLDSLLLEIFNHKMSHRLNWILIGQKGLTCVLI